ncbi:hypothetical protein NC653_004919 [Populus alba x Populus x berolinensis]|uniref:Uncharacterized protein n=1 Tax=Populus alba x Populus x berolinensis TaxID=444605 RepID=A0AAD6RB18_9ROSI|nr:hypothetical protein NC653_004919 [Populus alba x Populus x berolinensis]
MVESDIQSRMQPLKDQLTNTITHLQSVFETHVFVAICRGYWDRMGQDVLKLLGKQERKSIVVQRSWMIPLPRTCSSCLEMHYRRKTSSLLDRSWKVRSMLCKDAPNHKDSTYYY